MKSNLLTVDELWEQIEKEKYGATEEMGEIHMGDFLSIGDIRFLTDLTNGIKRKARSKEEGEKIVDTLYEIFSKTFVAGMSYGAELSEN